MSPRFLAPFVLASLSLTACAFDTGGSSDGGALDAQLRGRAFLDLAPTTTVGVCALDGDGNELPYVEPSVSGGRAVLRTTDDGWLLVEDLDVQLNDVVIPPGELGPDAVVLTNVRLSLGTQIAVQPIWSGDGEATWGTGDADLLLDWALVLDDGTPYQLATQKLGAAHFTVSVTRDANGALSATVDTNVSGTVDQLTGLVTLRDLTVAVDAVSPTVQ